MTRYAELQATSHFRRAGRGRGPASRTGPTWLRGQTRLLAASFPKTLPSSAPRARATSPPYSAAELMVHDKLPMDVRIRSAVSDVAGL